MKRILLLIAAIAAVVPAFSQTRYGVKSGILKAVISTGDQKSDYTLYWDDFGDKEKSVTTTDMGPELGKVSWAFLSVGDTTWPIDDNGKAKKPNPRIGYNWRALTERAYKEQKIEELRQEAYQGKTCTVYQYEQKQLMSKAKITVWVWEGVVLRQVIQKKLSKSVIELESLDLKPRFPKGTFDVPEVVE